MTQRRVRVLHVVNDLNHGGLERIVAELVRRTDPARFDTHLLALEYLGHFADGLEAFGTLHVAPRMSRLSMLYPAALARTLSLIDPDVVHIHSGVWYKASAAAAVAGIPRVLYTDHGRQHPDPWSNRWLDRQASRWTDVVIGVSKELQAALGLFVKYPSRIGVIPNGVDTTRHAPRADDGDFRREIGVASNVPLVGSTGRLESVKGYDVMLNAFARLLRDWPSAPSPQLVLVGDGESRAVLEAESSRLNIANSVHFLGWRRDIERITRAFQVFSMSSHSEGTSMSLLEAMSSGICPVVTDVGGNRTVLGAGLKHRLVAPADSGALADALAEALHNTAKRSRDGQFARERVVARFGLDTMVQRYEAVYSGEIPPDVGGE